MRGLERLPEHMRASVKVWIETGAPHPATMGDFMRYVLRNDLTGAVGCADRENRAAICAWADFLYNDAPQGCWGNERKLEEWHKAGGMNGPSR